MKNLDTLQTIKKIIKKRRILKGVILWHDINIFQTVQLFILRRKIKSVEEPKSEHYTEEKSVRVANFNNISNRGH